MPSAAGSAAPLAQDPLLLIRGVTSIGRLADNTIPLHDERVTRHHAMIQIDQAGGYLVEDLHSTNGTFLNGDRLKSPAPLKAGDQLRIGDTILAFESVPVPVSYPEGSRIRPEATVINLAKPPLVEPSAPDSLANTLWGGEYFSENYRPQAFTGWALKHLQDEDEGDYYVLKALDHPRYLRLSDRDVFLWNLMDGRHTLRDLLVAYFQAFRAMGAERLIDLLDELKEKGFLENVMPNPPTQQRGAFAVIKDILRRVVSAFYQKQFPLSGADEWMTRLYTSLAWRFYTRTGQVLLAVIALAGLAVFGFILLQGEYSLFRLEGSAALGLFVLALAGAVSIFLHEMGHALTVKSYNRQVRRVGFMIYIGMPVFFVDTSDMWMEPKGPRIQTSLAGPYTSFLVGSVTALAMLASPSVLVSALLFKLAAWSYIDAFFNLNPLLELDGYFILMDWLEIPLLRKRSLEFVRRDLWVKLRRRSPFSREEKLFSVFGILSAVWSVAAVGLFFFYQGPRLLGIFQGDLAAWITVITVALLLAVLGLLGLGARRARQKQHQASKEG